MSAQVPAPFLAAYEKFTKAAQELKDKDKEPAKAQSKSAPAAEAAKD